MSNGCLGKGVTVTSQAVKMYEVPSTGILFASVTVLLLNTGTDEATVKISASVQSQPSTADYIDVNMKLPGNGGSGERNCLVLGPGEKLFVEGNSPYVVVRVQGLEEEAA